MMMLLISNFTQNFTLNFYFKTNMKWFTFTFAAEYKQSQQQKFSISIYSQND